MNIKIEEQDHKTCIWLDGRLDTTTVQECEAKLLECIQTQETPDVVIDLSSLHYISSAGLRILLIVQKQISSKNGKLLLTKMQPQIKSIFDMTGFTSIFAIEEL